MLVEAVVRDVAALDRQDELGAGFEEGAGGQDLDVDRVLLAGNDMAEAVADATTAVDIR